MSLHPGSRVMYEGDSLLNTWTLAWSAPTLFKDPRHVFDAPAFLPYEDTLAFSEHLLFPSLLAWPLRVLSGNPLLAHNLLVLVFLTLSAYGMFALLRELTGDRGAALAGGVLYGFHTFIVNEAQRIQIQAQFFFPFGLLFLARHFARPRAATAAAFTLVVLLCGLSNNYYQLYMPLLYVVALPWLLSRCPRSERPRALGLLAISLIPVALVLGTLALRYLTVAQRMGFTRELPMGIGLEKYLATRPENWLYGETVPGVKLQTQAAHFTGLLPLMLAALALLAAWRRVVDRGLCLTAAAGAALFAILSLGQDVTLFGWRLAPGPYRVLYRFLPGFQLVRIPERLSVLSLFWLSVLAGLGAHALLRRFKAHRPVWALALVALVFLEHLSVPLRTIPIPVGREVPEVYRWLKTYPEARRVAEIPFYGPWLNRLDSLTMYYAIGSGRSIVNGYTGFYPPAYAFLRHKLSSEPGESFLATVERLNLDHLVVHPHLWKPADREAWLGFLASTPERLWLVRAFPEQPPRGEPAWDHGGELVYRLRPGYVGGRRPANGEAVAPLERVPIAPSPAWSASGSRGVEPGAVIDGDPATEWSPGDLSRPGDYLEVRFNEDHDIRGVRLLLTFPHTGYPGPLEVSARREDGRWRLMRFDRGRSDRELLERLLETGRDTWYAMDFDPVRANGIRLVVPRADPTLDIWRVGELQVYR